MVCKGVRWLFSAKLESTGEFFPLINCLQCFLECVKSPNIPTKCTGCSHCIPAQGPQPCSWHCTENEVFHYRFSQQMWPKTLKTADLVTFTEEIRNGKLHFLYSVSFSSTSLLHHCIRFNLSNAWQEAATGGVLQEKRCSLKFRKIHWKAPVPESLFRWSCMPEACSFIKKEALAQMFSCEFCEVSKNTFLTEHL